MKIILLNSIIGEATGYLKHGIGMVSACLKKAGFADVTIINNPDNEFVMYHDVDVVGINGLTSSISRIRTYANNIKKQNPKCVVFAGGASVTLSWMFLEDCKDIDYLYKGEGEITFVEIMKKYKDTGELPEERIIVAEPVHDVNKIPFVDRTGFENGEQRFTLFLDMPQPMYSMMNSRWCRKKCAYCAPAMSTLYGGIKKLRTIDNYMEELYTLPVNDMTLMMHDDNLLENKDWCLELIARFKKDNLYIPFVAQGYPPEICKMEQLLKDLRSIGLMGILVGFESGSNRMLKFMKKGSTREINIKAASILKDLGIRIQANIMFGSPTETFEEMMQTVDLYNNHINRPGFTVPSPAVYTPYPGSAWYDMLKDAGELNIGKNYVLYERYHTTAGKLKSVDYEAVKRATDQIAPWSGFVPQAWESRAKLLA